MITSLFPEAGGMYASIKNHTKFTHAGFVYQTSSSGKKSSVIIKYNTPRVTACVDTDSTGAFYIDTSDYDLMKLRVDPFDGVVVEWWHNKACAGLVVDETNEVLYVLHSGSKGPTLAKYSFSGELLWNTIDEMNTYKEITIGLDGYIYVYCTSTLYKFDSDGNLVNTVTHSFGNIYHFQVNEEGDIFAIMTSNTAGGESFGLGQLRRFNSSMEQIWSHNGYSAFMNSHRTFIDKNTCNMYTVTDSNSLNLMKINTDGETEWIGDCSITDFNYNQQIFMYKPGIICATSEENVLVAFDTDTGKVIKVVNDISIYDFKIFVAGDYACSFNESVYVAKPYYGTVIWNDGDRVSELYIVNPKNEDGGCMILISDEGMC